jgi:hypothetical protein
MRFTPRLKTPSTPRIHPVPQTPEIPTLQALEERRLLSTSFAYTSESADAPSDRSTLSGHQCLVFYVGGIPRS